MSATNKITCPQCKVKLPLAQLVQVRALATDVQEAGLLCPQCQHWTHSYYETPAIADRRARLLLQLERYQQAPAGPERAQLWEDYQTAKEAFGRFFTDDQRRVALNLKGDIRQNTTRQGSTDVL